MRDDDNRMPFNLIGAPATMFRLGGLKAIRITLFGKFHRVVIFDGFA
jgi:hypothetical protein